VGIEEMKESFERSKKALELKPGTGKKTATCSVQVVDGYTCLMQESRWRVVGDLHEKVGGNGMGPDPSQLVRMAFGSCAAMAYVQWAAVMDIELTGVEVIVETDHDYGGYYGTTDSPAGPIEVRYRVSIESDAPESDIIALIDKADRHSPLHDIFERPMKMKREIEVRRPPD
jgi:uncharacterized OsmC-like protein